MPLADGATFGRFRILDCCGRGGMGVVYRANEAQLNRTVALKVIASELVGGRDARERFKREARTIAKLEHAHIVPIHTVGFDEGQAWISMRFLAGGDLSDRLLHQGPGLTSATLRILEQVADALDFAHSEGVIHRDLKPSNVLLDDRGRAYLSDFGIARVADTSVTLTQRGVQLGTPAYMAPEQAEGKRPDHRADIYSFGIMAYELITGKLPYTADSPVTLLYQHVHEPVPLAPLKRVAPAFVDPIAKALAKNPSDRWDSAGEFVTALRNLHTKVQLEVGAPVRFPDTNLEAAVREALGQADGPLTRRDLETLTELDAELEAEGREIQELTGLEYCGNLTWLNLDNNQITDLAPLAGLTQLIWLDDHTDHVPVFIVQRTA
ncbi:MAG: protein kinase [Acidobacteriota bacterium]|nr:protein kinase [Acidobacteriota bacterium]